MIMKGDEMLGYKSPELMTSAFKLVKNVLKISGGDEVVITADSASDMRVVETIAQACRLVDAKPLVAWIESAPQVGKASDKYNPINSLRGLLENADVWIELNKSWLLYSTPYEYAMKSPKLKYMCLVGLDTEMIIRTILRVDLELLFKFQRELADVTRNTHHMKITSPGGMNVEFDNDPNRNYTTQGEVRGPGAYMMPGQSGFAPIESTLNGKIVFDGSVWPPATLGLLSSPIILTVEKGIITDISGGADADVYREWVKSFNDPNMYHVAHGAYGINPGAKLTGNVLEDERIWGGIEWGIGFQSPHLKGSWGNATTHSDGICRTPTVKGDNEFIIKDGQYVHPRLREMAQKLTYY